MQGEYAGLVIVRIRRIRASSFLPRKKEVVLEIFFDDNAEKQISRITSISTPEETADSVLRDIITMEENINMEFDGESFGGEPRVMIDDYEQVLSQLTEFLAVLSARMEAVRANGGAAGYLDLIRSVNMSELRFDG